MSRRRSLLTPRAAILAFVLGGLLFTSVYPMRRWIDLRHKIATLEAEERSLDRQSADLVRRREALRRPEEIERLARENLGMVRPGEVPFVIVTPGTAPRLAPPVEAPDQAPEHRSAWSRWWSAFRRAVHIGR